ncbi:MAG: (2Fe-2S)-binding protein [Deinococcales bacterium]|nr:(2Fe-2S)-binding protein [Deinococcales bacterium]
MPTVTIDGRSAEVPAGRRLVLAIQDLGVEIGHRCGGKARCTTCRVEFVSGEPTAMTAAERSKLEEKGLLGQVRLACQIVCEHDMEVRPLMTLQSEGWPDTGPAPAEEVEPEARWFEPDELVSRP